MDVYGNLNPGQNDNDVLTKKQIYDHIKANGGGSSSTPVDLSDHLKRDGSVAMTGHLQMNYNRIEEIRDPRDGKTTLYHINISVNGT